MQYLTMLHIPYLEAVTMYEFQCFSSLPTFPQQDHIILHYLLTCYLFLQMTCYDVVTKNIVLTSISLAEVCNRQCIYLCGYLSLLFFQQIMK